MNVPLIMGASGTQMFIHWSHVHTAEVSLLSAVYILYHMDIKSSIEHCHLLSSFSAIVRMM